MSKEKAVDRLGAELPPDFAKEVRKQAIDEEMTIKEVMIEALSDWLAKKRQMSGEKPAEMTLAA